MSVRGFISLRAAWRECADPLKRMAAGTSFRCLSAPTCLKESRAICTDHDVAYLDLVGNARLAFDTVYIERAVRRQAQR